MSTNAKALIVVYDFPPEIGGGGVMRTVKAVKYLRETRWQPVVLTVERQDTLMPDPALLEQVAGVPVHRCRDWICRFNRKEEALPAAGGEGKSSGGFKGAAKEWLKEILVPDRRAGWLLPALRLGLRLLRREGIELIYATAPPQTPLLVGYLLSLLTGKKLVLDYRDAWGGNALFASNRRWKNALNGWLEKRILARASLVLATTPAMAADLRERGAAVELLYNGFDREDLRQVAPRPLSPGKLNCVYLGGFDGHRTAAYFVRALDGLEEAVRERLAFHFVGPNGPQEAARLGEVQGTEVHLHGSVPHGEALRFLLAADLLLIFIYPEEDSDRAIPGKIFEYLAAGKPILAFCEEQSALGRLLREQGVGRVVPPKDTAAMQEALRLAAHGTDSPGSPTLEALKPFDRRENALRLASLFDRVTGMEE